MENEDVQDMRHISEGDRLPKPLAQLMQAEAWDEADCKPGTMKGTFVGIRV
jgi:hypothetical protein